MTAIPLHRHRRGRRHWKGAVLAATALTLQACTGGIEPESGSGTAAGTDVMLEATASVPEVFFQSPAVVETPPLVPVYWLGDGNGLLYREFIPGDSAGDPIAAAIWAMTSSEPLDDDYYSPWQPASSVNTSISPDNVITVDISSDAFPAGVGADIAGPAVQQLVYTATAAASNSGLISGGNPSSVRLLVDGKAGYNAFGHIRLGSVLSRDVSAMAPVWIINPQDGSVRPDRTVIIQGSTTSTDDSLQWRVRRVDRGGGVPAENVIEGTVPVEAGTGSVSVYEFSVALEPGTYLVEAFEAPSENSGASDPGPGSTADDKLISIR